MKKFYKPKAVLVIVKTFKNHHTRKKYVKLLQMWNVHAWWWWTCISTYLQWHRSHQRIWYRPSSNVPFQTTPLPFLLPARNRWLMIINTHTHTHTNTATTILRYSPIHVLKAKLWIGLALYKWRGGTLLLKTLAHVHKPAVALALDHGLVFHADLVVVGKQISWKVTPFWFSLPVCLLFPHLALFEGMIEGKVISTKPGLLKQFTHYGWTLFSHKWHIATSITLVHTHMASG